MLRWPIILAKCIINFVTKCVMPMLILLLTDFTLKIEVLIIGALIAGSSGTTANFMIVSFTA